MSTIKYRPPESSLTGEPSLGQARHPLQRENHLQCDDGDGNIASAGGIVEAFGYVAPRVALAATDQQMPRDELQHEAFHHTQPKPTYSARDVFEAAQNAAKA